MTTTPPRISDHTLGLWGRMLAGGSVLSTLISVGILVVAGRWDFVFDVGVAHAATLAVGLGALMWMTIRTQPRNREIWVLAAAAACAAVFCVCVAVFAAWGQVTISGFDLDLGGGLSPAEIPTAVAIFAGTASWIWLPAFFLILTLGLFWFPDGQSPTPRWRWVGWYSTAVIAAGVVAGAWYGRPTSAVPIFADTAASESSEDVGFAVLVVLTVVATALSVAALVVRYRSSAGATRHQIRWIAWGGAFFAATYAALLLGSIIVGDPGSTDVTTFVLLISEALLVASFFVAIARYRLYDIDVVISRTVTYGILAVFITGVYVAVVVGIGTLVGRGDETNLGLAIAATAVVAILFEPIRSRVQRWANRLVFGERATPYAVLSELTARLSETDTNEQALERLAELVASGTGAKQAIVWLRVGDHFRPEATLSTGDMDPLDSDAHPFMFGETLVTELTSVPGDAAEAIHHGGELLGVLAIRKGTRDPVTRADHDLLRDVAAGSGPLLRNIRLNAELAERAEELRVSRRRLVAAQDLERRRLERNLHDGAQQQVVAIKVKLGLAKTLAEREEADQIAEAVGNLADDTQRAVDGMRVAARGIYPPLLEAEGLRAALVAVARDASIGIHIDAQDIGRYAPEIEATVYFSVLAAVAHRAGAPADGASVTVRDDRDGLRFAVRGIAVSPGPELTAVADRLDALGGTLSIESEDGGTVVSGHLPTTALEPA